MRHFILAAAVSMFATIAQAEGFKIHCPAITDGGPFIGAAVGKNCITSDGTTVDIFAISLGVLDLGEGIPDAIFECNGELKPGKNVLYGIKLGAGAVYGYAYGKWANRSLGCRLSGVTYPMGVQMALSRLSITTK